jgi:5-methylthioadenosine/S-adenosylhomocysteine deaminase
MTIYEADWVCPVSSPPIPDGRVAVENGRIVPLPSSSEGSTVRFPGCAIIPGFVNAHSHLELTVLRGFLEDLPLATWIPRLTHAKYEVLSRDEMLFSSRLGAIEMLRAGVTCVGEVMDLGTAWDAMREFRLRGIAFQEVFGPAENQAADALEGLRKKIDAYRKQESDTVRVGVSPHALYTVSAALYQAVNAFALSERLPLTTHIAESVAEGLFVRHGSGPFAERWRARGIPVSAAGCSPIAYIDRFGLVRGETLLVHGVDLEDRDLEILRNKRPTLVHCPKSNAKLAHGIARISEIRQAGIVVGLGTDSVASNNVVDMFEEMRSAVFQQRVRTQTLESLDAHTAFHMATLGGAECLGLAGELGSLDVGKWADFVVVDLNDPAVQPVYDPIEAMVYSASRQNVRATFIGGEELRVDANDLVRDCAIIAKRLQSQGLYSRGL